MKKSIGTNPLLAIMCFAMMPVAPAHAANWVYLGKSKQGNASYFDDETIQRSGSKVTVWTKTDYSQSASPSLFQGNQLSEDITRVRIDCVARTSTNLMIVFYYVNGKSDIAEYPPRLQTERTIVPGSTMEAQMEAVC